MNQNPDFALQQDFTLNGELTYFNFEMLNRGGYGITYRAKAVYTLGRIKQTATFAVKEYFPRDLAERNSNGSVSIVSGKEQVFRECYDEFCREGKMLHDLNHKSIVPVNEVIETNGTIYYVMSYLGGMSLTRYVEEYGGRLSEEEARRVMRSLLDAVAYLHGKHLNHLDIKPENVMMADSDSGGKVPVLIDFGVSKHFHSNGKQTSRLGGKGVTDGYAPLEQYAGITTFSPKADIYALGATFFYMLTGKSPLKASELTADWILANIPHGTSEETTNAICRAMERDFLQRTADVKDFYKAIVIQKKQETPKIDNTEPVNKTIRISDSLTKNESDEKPKTNHLSHSKEGNDNNSGKRKSFRYILAGVLAVIAVAGLIFSLSKNTLTASEMYAKGEDYFHGKNGVKQDYTEAVKWYRLSAEQGDAQGQHNLGYMYEFGLGVPQDFAEAEKWYRKAAEQGDSIGQLFLGYMYRDAKGVPQDYSEAVKWFRKSAEQGDADAQNDLGVMCLDGLGVPQDYAEALKWFRKAAEQGNAKGQYNLGYMYRNGYGVSQDYSEALKWFRKAADQGNVNGQNSIGDMYFTGCGVSQDYSKAVEWFRKAAEWGNAAAQCNLGYMYEKGYGVTQDYTEAAKWYGMAAEQGDDAGQFNLGVMYEYGDGVKKDLNIAKHWYEKAAAQGNEDAKKVLKKLNGK